MIKFCLKDEVVLSLSDTGGVMGKIVKINNPELLPLSLRDNCTDETFRQWLQERRIPDEREGFAGVKARFQPKLNRVKNWFIPIDYLSLSDQYWIKSREERWKTCNFFTNTYKDDVCKMFFSPWELWNATRISRSPDLTTGGVLKKGWKQKSDKTSYLIKAGDLQSYISEDKDNGSRQDPLSEVLVSVITERLGVIKSAGYDLHIEGVEMCCKCDNFVTPDTDLVLAKDIYFNIPKKEGESVFEHLLRVAEFYDIPDAELFLETMVFIDKLTGNQDRNLSNIGFLRNINTMKFIGPAPLFDCGNAYWSTKPIADDTVKSKMFYDVENEIFDRLRKKYNMGYVFSNVKIKEIIKKYPGISDRKKENLQEAIDRRNARLLESSSWNR